MDIDESELELARQVHYAFLPETYEDEGIEVTVTAVPHQGLGGDYCGIVPLPEGRVALTMCDATGHGLASALYAARVNTYVLALATRTPEPSLLIESLNDFLFRRMSGANMHATFCAVIMDAGARTWSFAGAGHPPAIHYRAATRDTVLIKSTTPMLGAFETLPMPPLTTTCELAPGDRILLLTDGLIDARNADEELFGLERLQACVVKNAELTLSSFHEALLTAATAHGRGALGDDALLLSVRSKAPQR